MIRWLLEWSPYVLAGVALAGDFVLTARRARDAARDAEERAALNRAIGRAGYQARPRTPPASVDAIRRRR